MEPKRCVRMNFFFYGIISTSPPDCKANDCHFVSIRHFRKMRQIQNGEFFSGALIEKDFDIIKYSQNIYQWMANIMEVHNSRVTKSSYAK